MNPTLLALLLCFAVTFAGIGWINLLALKTKGAVETFAWGFVVGSVWLCLVRMIAIVIPPVASPIVVWILLAAPVAALIRHRRVSLSIRSSVGFLPAILVVGLSLWFAAQKPTWNIDALRRWALHAKWTSIEKTLVPETVEDVAWASTHPSYPPMVPSLLSFGIDHGADPDVGLRPFMPFYFLALLGVIYGFLARRDQRLAAMVTLAFACTPAFFWQSLTGLGADAVLADIPLALFTCACAAAILLFKEGSKSFWVAAAIAGAGAALTKQEGLPICVAFLLIACFTAWREGLGKGVMAPLGKALAFVVAGSVGWKILARSMPVMSGENYLSTESVGTLFEQLDRLPPILARLGQEMIDFHLWGPLWLIAFGATIATILCKWIWSESSRPRHAVTLLLFVLAGQVIVVLAYLVSGWHNGNYKILMDASVTRLLIHTSPLIALWFACLLSTSATPTTHVAPSAGTPQD
ncbi:MAG: hypothetical protein GY747_01640 [Planctomycetes bacterium]|nr:hypothetical protein [Planctomycetota bacterium]MCP4769930.1 hypothetical protein [Planctomycetota bacterium]